MPAPVIVLLSSVISKIRRGRREGGSVARTRQRCTLLHAHAAILQAALASRKMAARAHAASCQRPALPRRAPLGLAEAAGTQQWVAEAAAIPLALRERGALGPRVLPWRESGHLSAGCAHGAKALAVKHCHRLPGWSNHNMLLLRKATLPRACALAAVFPLDISSAGANAGLAPLLR